jgi:hypothetical protein
MTLSIGFRHRREELDFDRNGEGGSSRAAWNCVHVYIVVQRGM